MKDYDIDWFSPGVAFHYGQYMEDKKLLENKYIQMKAFTAALSFFCINIFDIRRDFNNAYKKVG